MKGGDKPTMYTLCELPGSRWEADFRAQVFYLCIMPSLCVRTFVAESIVLECLKPKLCASQSINS